MTFYRILQRRRCLGIIFVVLISIIFLILYVSSPVLRIYDVKTGELYVEANIKVDDKLFFGWTHSLEKIPWHENYVVDKDYNFVLQEISFPAFGAGIPENKGTSTRIEDGIIYMSGINEIFPHFVWLNSHFATGEIKINGETITKGDRLPEHRQLMLIIERRIA